MSEERRRRMAKDPEDWVIFIVAAANMALAAWYAYRDYEQLLSAPQWYIHLIIAVALMWALLRGAERKARKNPAGKNAEEDEKK